MDYATAKRGRILLFFFDGFARTSTALGTSAPDFTTDHFRRSLAQFATGVTVVTVQLPDGTFHGVTVSSFNSVSLEPPLVLWSLAHKARSMPVFAAAQHYVINVLAADQAELAKRFARTEARRFDGLQFELSCTGLPIFPGAAELAAMSAAAVQHWTDLAQARRALLPLDAGETLENIGALFSRYRQQVGKQLLFLPRLLEAAGLITPLAIHITDLGKTVRASYRDGFSVLGEAAAFHISMHSANAGFLFKNEYGFNTTHVNGRFGVATADALALFSRFFMPQNLAKNGYGVKHPFFTARYLVGSVLSRTARWIGVFAG